MVTNLKDRWISIDLYKMQSSQGSIGTVRCGLESIDQLASDTAPLVQTGLAYASNPFVAVKTLDTSPIQTTYQLSVDQTNFKAFYTNFNKLDGFQSDQGCTAAITRFVSGDLADTTVDLSISRPEHHLRSMTIHDGSNSTTIQANYGKEPEIVVPTDVTTYDQIAGSLIKSILPSFLGAQ
jgi:hypothetical protein